MTKTKNRLEISLDDLRQAPQITSTTQPRPPVREFPPVQKRVAFDHGYAAVPPAPPSTGADAGASGGSRRAPLFAALGAAAAVALIAGAVLIGQSTRMSDAEVAKTKNQAVSTAVSATQQQAQIHEQAAVGDAVTTQKHHDQAVTHRVRVRMQRAGDRRSQQSFNQGQQTGYSNGQANGYQSGHSDGYEQGVQDASEPACSDDPTVTWLPYC